MEKSFGDEFGAESKGIKTPAPKLLMRSIRQALRNFYICQGGQGLISIPRNKIQTATRDF
jgi:hypothetical protein